MEPKDRLYWMRFFLAIVTGILCFILKLGGRSGISFIFLMYVLSCYIARLGLKIKPNEVRGIGSFLFTGIIAFLLLTIMIWTLLFTLFP